jgi:hypothetical protein
VAGLWPAATFACNVPVFRYALERWSPETYELVAFHRGPEAGFVRRVEDAAARANANLQVTAVDVTAGVPEPWRDFAATNRIASFPRLVLRYPLPYRGIAGADAVWNGPLNDATLARLLDSPARRRIARGIAAGDVAVWVFIAGANDATNRAALARLQTALDAFVKEKETEEPRTATTGDTPEERAVDPEAGRKIEIRARFSIVEVRADDPDETVLVAMLRQTEPDLAQFADKPMVFPVFGQGRALFSLVGDGIAANQITDACEFLFGDCSCTVKEQNPGTDLLIAADWAAAVAEPMVTDEPPPALTGVAPEAPPFGGPGPAAKAEASSDPAPARHVGLLWPAVAIGLLALAGIVIASVRIARRGRD